MNANIIPTNVVGYVEFKVAMYFWSIDEKVSNMLLTSDDIIKSYLS